MGEATPSIPRAKLGLIALTALVVGNMVGSGVFLLPSSLATYGGVSLVGWGVTALGSLILGLTFARLSRRTTAAAGPYAYTRLAFGEFAAFLVGWGYWISCLAGQASVAVAMVGYLGEFFPRLVADARLGAGVAIATIICLSGVNTLGVHRAGLVQIVTTVIKMLPLVAIAAFGLSRFEPGNLQPFVPEGESLLPAILASVALTLWAFQGLECAAMAAGEAEAPKRNVPRATLFGILIATVLYMTSTVAVMGLVPRAELMTSTAPFADAAGILWGPTTAKVIAAGAAISCFGALNGWILVAGQLPLAIARDGLLPAALGRTSARGVPVTAFAVSSTFVAGLVLANYSASLVKMFTGMILLSALSTLVPFAFCAMAELKLTLQEQRRGASGGVPIGSFRFGVVIACAAFVYALVAIGGAGRDTVYWGFLLLLGGIPFFVLARARSEAP